MTEIDLGKLRGELVRFVLRFKGCFRSRPTRRHFMSYVHGQLSSLPRKSVEPIADWAAVAPRTLQEFLSLAQWDEERLRDHLQYVVRTEFGPPRDYGTIGVLDETSFPKRGNETACVQRQYCGSTGKIDNCVVSIHLAYVNGEDHALIDSELYVPEETWAKDRLRCRKAGIPDDILYRPFYQIALEQVRLALERGVRLDWIGADERYGRVVAFLEGLEALQKRYVLEVPPQLTGWTVPPELLTEDSDGARRGRPRLFPRLADDAPPARQLGHLVRHAHAFRAQPWIPYHIKDTDKGPEIWEAKAVCFYQNRGGLPFGPLWLMVACNVLDGEVKYFLSNAGPGTPLEVLLWVAFSRWHVERCFEDKKGEIGMDHFEVRHYGSIRRHLFISMVSYLFLALERQRLGGKKPADDRLPASHGHQRIAQFAGAPSPRSLGTPQEAQPRHPANPATQRSGGPIAPPFAALPLPKNGIPNHEAALLHPAPKLAL